MDTNNSNIDPVSYGARTSNGAICGSQLSFSQIGCLRNDSAPHRGSGSVGGGGGISDP